MEQGVGNGFRMIQMHYIYDVLHFLFLITSAPPRIIWQYIPEDGNPWIK